ncbi:unnamed protein product, partial [Symbiodinium sp. KB8]
MPSKPAATVYLELVDHLLDVFSSHRWGQDSPEELEYQLADRKIRWQEASVESVRKEEQPRLRNCADQAQALLLRRGPHISATELREALEALWLHPEPPKPLHEVPPPRTMEWTEHAKLRGLGEQLLVDLGKIRKGGRRGSLREALQDVGRAWCEEAAEELRGEPIVTDSLLQNMCSEAEELFLEEEHPANEVRRYWKELLAKQDLARPAPPQAVEVPSSDDEPLLESYMQGTASEWKGDWARGGSIEWLPEDEELVEVDELLPCAEKSSAEDLRIQEQLSAAAFAYGSLVDDLLHQVPELEDLPSERADIELDTVLINWQQRQVQGQDLDEITEGLLTSLADDAKVQARHFLADRRETGKPKVSLAQLLEAVWEQKLREEAVDPNRPWTNCELLYRRGEALLSTFASSVHCAQKQKMKASQIKEQLSKISEDWCTRTLAAAVGADCVTYKLLREMASDAQSIFEAK